MPTLWRWVLVVGAAILLLWLGQCAWGRWSDTQDLKAERDQYRVARDSLARIARAAEQEADRLRTDADADHRGADQEAVDRGPIEDSLAVHRGETARLRAAARTVEQLLVVVQRQDKDLATADLIIGSQGMEIESRKSAYWLMRASNDSLESALAVWGGRRTTDSLRIDQLERQLASATGQNKILGFLPAPKIVLGLGGATGQTLVLLPGGGVQTGWGATVGVSATVGWEIRL